MAAKKKSLNVLPAEESDQLVIRPLGAGQEVGRSCIFLEYKGKKILLDCGIHPGMNGMDALPYFDSIQSELHQIDLLLISHFHLDHCVFFRKQCSRCAITNLPYYRPSLF